MTDQKLGLKQAKAALLNVATRLLQSNGLSFQSRTSHGGERTVIEVDLTSTDSPIRSERVADVIADYLFEELGNIRVTPLRTPPSSVRCVQYFFAVNFSAFDGLLPVRIIELDRSDGLVIEIGVQPRIEV